MKKKLLAQIFIVIIILLVTFITSGFFGSANIDAKSVIDILKSKILGEELVENDKGSLSIVWDLRIPRALLGIAIGGGLAVSGACMQAITQNILANPYTLGVSAGALVGASATIYFFPTSPRLQLMTSIGSFLGASLSQVIVNLASKLGTRNSNTKLLLAGMSISTFLSALSSYFIISVDDINSTRNIISWQMGSLAQARWDNIKWPIVIIVIASFYFIIRARDFDLMALGEGTALSLGVNYDNMIKQSLFISALISSVCVSVAGIIGFVGFLVPHAVRIIFGGEHIKIFPMSFVVGGIFLMWMDILARTVLAPRELPIGVLTALFGSPLFIWILIKRKVV